VRTASQHQLRASALMHIEVTMCLLLLGLVSCRSYFRKGSRAAFTGKPGLRPVYSDSRRCQCLHSAFGHYAATLSSLSAPRSTIFSVSSGNGRCRTLASSHGARIQTSLSSAVVRITGMALGWIGPTTAFGAARGWGRFRKSRTKGRACPASRALLVLSPQAPPPTARPQCRVRARQGRSDFRRMNWWRADNDVS
jgi:hypothetical protein